MKRLVLFHENLGLLVPLELPNGRAVQAAADFEPRVTRVEDHDHEAQQSLHHDRNQRPENRAFTSKVRSHSQICGFVASFACVEEEAEVVSSTSFTENQLNLFYHFSTCSQLS